MSSDRSDIPGGIVHSYLGYDPKRFPPPSAESDCDSRSSTSDHAASHEPDGRDAPSERKEFAPQLER